MGKKIQGIDVRRYSDIPPTTLVLIELFRRRELRDGCRTLSHGEILQGLKELEPDRFRQSENPEGLEYKWTSRAGQEGYVVRAGGLLMLSMAARDVARLEEPEPAMQATG
jgi:hypothetical protein